MEEKSKRNRILQMSRKYSVSETSLVVSEFGQSWCNTFTWESICMPLGTRGWHHFVLVTTVKSMDPFAGTHFMVVVETGNRTRCTSVRRAALRPTHKVPQEDFY